MKLRTRKQDVLNFLIECINQCEADGYQAFEKLGGEVSLPSIEFTHDGKTKINMSYGDRNFQIVIHDVRNDVRKLTTKGK